MASFLFVATEPMAFPGDGTFVGFEVSPGDKIETGEGSPDLTELPFSRYFDPVNGPPVTPPDDTQPQE